MLKLKILEPPSREWDALFFYQFCILGVCAILMMFYSDGESTIKYINGLNGLEMPQAVQVNTSYSSGSFNFTIQQNYSLAQTNARNVGELMRLTKDISKQNLKIPYIMLFLYWVVSPLINVIFFFRGATSLKRVNSDIDRGVKENGF